MSWVKLIPLQIYKKKGNSIFINTCKFLIVISFSKNGGGWIFTKLKALYILLIMN